MIFKRKIGKNGEIVIPKPIREMFRLKKGDIIIFEVINNEIWIKPEK